MKAVLCTKYGGPEVLKLGEAPKPEPKPDQVRIRIIATAVTASDTYIRGYPIPLSWRIPLRIMLGIRKPRKPIIGLIFSGEIEKIGKHTSKFKIGDEVYGMTGFNFGCYAEYCCVKEENSKSFGCIAIKPDNITHEEATAAAYGGLLAVQFLEKGGIKENPIQQQKVLIYGGSSTTGTIAIQVAKSYGAHVTTICSYRNVEMVKNLGADEVFDYTKDHKLPHGAKYDVVLDAVGTAKSSPIKKESKKAISTNGKYASIDNGSMEMDSNRLLKIKRLVEKGIFKPVLDKTYPLEEIVEAHRYVDSQHKKGGVAITI